LTASSIGFDGAGHGCAAVAGRNVNDVAPVSVSAELFFEELHAVPTNARTTRRITAIRDVRIGRKVREVLEKLYGSS
jgi:hypothetical protein